MRNQIILLVTAVMILSGCAYIEGTVIPYENGQYQGVSIGATKRAALEIAVNDAKITCKNDGKQQYRVISQDLKFNAPPEIDTGNKIVDVIGKLAIQGSMDREDAYEVTTVFKCL